MKKLLLLVVVACLGTGVAQAKAAKHVIKGPCDKSIAVYGFTEDDIEGARRFLNNACAKEMFDDL